MHLLSNQKSPGSGRRGAIGKSRCLRAPAHSPDQWDVLHGRTSGCRCAWVTPSHRQVLRHVKRWKHCPIGKFSLDQQEVQLLKCNWQLIFELFSVTDFVSFCYRTVIVVLLMLFNLQSTLSIRTIQVIVFLSIDTAPWFTHVTCPIRLISCESVIVQLLT